MTHAIKISGLNNAARTLDPSNLGVTLPASASDFTTDQIDRP